MRRLWYSAYKRVSERLVSLIIAIGCIVIDSIHVFDDLLFLLVDKESLDPIARVCNFHADSVFLA